MGMDWRRGGGEAARYRGPTVALRCNAVQLLVADDGRWRVPGSPGCTELPITVGCITAVQIKFINRKIGGSW